MTRERLAALVRERFVFAKAAAILLWLAWFVSIAVSGFKRDIEGKPLGADHLAFYSAAKLIDEGQGSKIYDYAFLGRYQAELINHPGAFLDAYRNPPFYALLYIPGARLPYLASFWIWSALSIAMLWVGLVLLESQERWNAFAYSFSFYPVFAVISFGQNSLLSFVVLCLCFRLLEQRRLLLAGMAAGLLFYKPQLLTGLGLWWLLDFRHYARSLFGMALTGCIWTAISVLIVPKETAFFIAKLREIAAYDNFMFWNMHNARAFGTLIALDNKRVGDVVGLIGSAAGIAAFIWFWREHRREPAIMFAAAIYLTLWASPHTMIYEWTLAIIPAVVLWDHIRERRDDWVLVFATSWIIMFISTFVAKGLFEATGGWAIQLSAPVMGAVGIWVMRVLSRQKHKACADPPPRLTNTQ